ncbi:MAG: hypothetical protein AAGA77_05540 [Bacteroidota bacterium]
MKLIHIKAVFFAFASILMFSVIFSSCQKNNSNGVENQTSIVERSDDSGNLPDDYLENSNNPYNTVGIEHNDITLNSGALEANTLEEIVEMISAYTNEPDLTLDLFLENGVDIDYENKAYTAQYENDMSDEAVDFVASFAETALNGELSFEETMIYVIELENDIVFNSNYSESDKESILSMLAVFRHSGSMWYNEPPLPQADMPKINWREVAVADGLGAIGGVGFGLLGSVIGAAAYSLFDIVAQKLNWRRKLILGVYHWLFG